MKRSAQAFTTHQEYRVLGLYDLYRIIIGIILVLLASTDLDDEILKLTHPQLYSFTSWSYLGLNLLIALSQRLRSQRPVQMFSLALVDIIFLSCLFYAAGGAPSGIGNLLIISVAIANILLRGRIGLLIAAIASISLIYLTFYMSLTQPSANLQYVQVGTLGALCFAAALFIQGITLRLRTTESLAAQRATDVANLEELNELILQRMRTGILALDSQHRVLMMNQSAQRLLGQECSSLTPLAQLHPELLKSLEQWQHNPTLRPESLHTTTATPVVQPSFAELRHGNQFNTLIFLDDISQLTQQAQQLKLAALGRLTAGIAHEIRNPLGAISHAAQLLQESEDLHGHDQRLAQIIQDQSRRMNLVIENVLQLSRRRLTEPQLLDLKYWVHRFASEFRSSAQADQLLHVDTPSGSIQTRMDPHQLTQVLSNLVQNGMRHSARQHKQASVWLKLYKDPDSQLPTLEIIDNGSGVPHDQVQDIFEPFFTTENKGTGLGLYLSREMCESNQARLDYLEREQPGGCFRITFAHPRKLS